MDRPRVDRRRKAPIEQHSGEVELRGQAELGRPVGALQLQPVTEVVADVFVAVVVLRRVCWRDAVDFELEYSKEQACLLQYGDTGSLS